MNLALTGFVSEQSGSVASANALLLQRLLVQGHQIDFFSKAAFVDPRPLVGEQSGFRFVNVTNDGPDRFRQKVEKVAGLSFAAARLDAWTYNRKLVRLIAETHQRRNYAACLWLGDYARGTVPGVPTISFAQGPPGTDARAVLARSAEIRRLAGFRQALKWTTLAKIRLSSVGLPPIRKSDHIIVGSQQSCRTLNQRYGIDLSRLSSVPYPIDLDHFKPQSIERNTQSGNGALRILWLGRIVPRKRLDLFLDGASLAIRQGINIQLSIVGAVGFVSGYEKLIGEFPFAERLEWIKGIERRKVPGVMQRHDVLAQPSDEEDFGSSAAEAQACGLPVIVGRSNGNADYLCSRDLHLRDDRPETFAETLREMAARRKDGRWGETTESRKLAEEKFAIEGVAAQLTDVLQRVTGRSYTSAVSG